MCKSQCNNEHAYEAFYYDDLHRLTRTSRARSATALTPGHSDALSVEYGYDAVGNIRFKTDFSAHDGMAYRYGDSQRRARLDNSNAGPNAVRHITLKRAINDSASRQLRYDNNGNLISDGVRLISYNAMNKPVTIHVSGQRYLHPNDSHRTVTQTTDFAYGSDNLRYKQRSGDVAQTIYIGQQYTEQTLANGTTQQRVYIDDVAIDITSISRGGKHNRIQSLHTDRLGSTVGVFNTSGYLHESRSYDAFGTPRGSLNSDRFNAILGSTVSPRGFTQHEHLDGAQLIHMNGRVYDYHLGRFLSVDPFIHGGSQGINPYSYIMNNPLAGTDPTGYLPECGGNPYCNPENSFPFPGSSVWNCMNFCVSAGSDNGSDNSDDTSAKKLTNTEDSPSSIGSQAGVAAAGVSLGNQASVVTGDSSTSGGTQYDGTYFFGGAGIDGDYIADMVTAFQEAGISDVHAVDGSRWSMNDGESPLLGTGLDAFIGVLALNEEIDLGDRISTTPERLINKGDGKGQFNLVGYSYGSLVAAQVAMTRVKKGGTVDNLVLIGSPIDSGFLKTLRSTPAIKNVIVKDLVQHGDTIRAGMSGASLFNPAVFIPLAKQFGNGTGHFHYAPMSQVGNSRRRELAKELHGAGLR